MRKLIAIASISLLASCAAPTKTVLLKSQFDAKETATHLVDGENTIKGSGLIRQNGGGVVTCAGQQVWLVPATDYAKERILNLYGNTDKGGRRINAMNLKFTPDYPEYHRLTKTTICDAQGYFKFNKMADGEYFVGTVIAWQVSKYGSDGGTLFQKVKVTNHETQEIVLAP